MEQQKILRKTISFENIVQNLLIIWFFSVVLAGCTARKFVPPPDPEHFLTITPEKDDSLQEIAQRHLGDPALAFRIAEFNNLVVPDSNRELIVPLNPTRPFGISRTGLQTVPILSYQSFSKRRSNRSTISKRRFETQMSFLKKNHYQVISFNQMLDLHKGNDLPRKSVVIAIDAGKLAYKIAYPILKKYGYPFTVFIRSDWIGRSSRTDLNWGRITEMTQNSDVSLGCYPNPYRNLTTPKPGELFARHFFSTRRELAQLKTKISKNTGKDPIHFAYAFGKADQLVRELVKESGFLTGSGYSSDPSHVNSFLARPHDLTLTKIDGSYNLSKFEKNLSTFQVSSLNQGSLVQETSKEQHAESRARQFEENELWPEALNEWRLIRDTLLKKAGAEYLSLYGEKPSPPSINSTVFYGQQKEKIEIAEQRIKELESRIQESANLHYSQAIEYFSSNQPQRGEWELIHALYLKPDFDEARKRLHLESQKTDFTSIIVKPEDSTQSIAEQVYHDSTKSFVVGYFADQNGGLKPGTELNLPNIQPQIVRARTAPPPRKPLARCGVTTNKPKTELAIDYSRQAEKYYLNNQIAKAIHALEISVCLDPEISSTASLLNHLRSLSH